MNGVLPEAETALKTMTEMIHAHMHPKP